MSIFSFILENDSITDGLGFMHKHACRPCDINEYDFCFGFDQEYLQMLYFSMQRQFIH